MTTHLAISTPFPFLPFPAQWTRTVVTAHISREDWTSVQIVWAFAELAPVFRGGRVGGRRVSRVRQVGSRGRRRCAFPTEFLLELCQSCFELVFPVNLRLDERFKFRYFAVELAVSATSIPQLERLHLG